MKNSNAMKIELQKVPFFKDLPEDALEAISTKLRKEFYPKDTIVFTEGDPGDALYLVESGQVKVLSEIGGEERIFAYLGAGNPFGEMAILTGERRTATIRVVIDATLWVLYKSDFEELLEEYPAILKPLTQELSRRLRRTSRQPTEEARHKIIAVLGAKVGELAQSLACQTGERVLLYNVTERELPLLLENSGVVIRTAERGLSPGELANEVSRVVEQTDWVLLYLPPREDAITLKAVDLADLIIYIGTQKQVWMRKLHDKPCWSISAAGEEINRAARKLAQRTVGLALSSGSARGIAHIGVLKVLKEEGIPIDMIAGTSAGSLMGALYSSGMSIEEMAEWATNMQSMVKFRSGLWDFNLIPPWSGIIKGHKTAEFLREVLQHKTFEDLYIPLYIVAADVLTGQEVVFDEGDVAQAVRSSISIIGIFSPARYKRHYLIDGGAVNPVPTSVLAQRGADIIIASSVIPSLEDRAGYGRRKDIGKKAPDFFGVLFGMMETMESEIIKTRMGPADIVIRPSVESITTMEFDRAAEFIELGERAARREIARIKKLLAPRPTRGWFGDK